MRGCRILCMNLKTSSLVIEKFHYDLIIFLEPFWINFFCLHQNVMFRRKQGIGFGEHATQASSGERLACVFCFFFSVCFCFYFLFFLVNNFLSADREASQKLFKDLAEENDSLVKQKEECMYIFFESRLILLLLLLLWFVYLLIPRFPLQLM